MTFCSFIAFSFILNFPSCGFTPRCSFCKTNNNSKTSVSGNRAVRSNKSKITEINQEKRKASWYYNTRVKSGGCNLMILPKNRQAKLQNIKAVSMLGFEAENGGDLREHQPIPPSAGHLWGEMSEYVISRFLWSKKPRPPRSQEVQEGTQRWTQRYLRAGSRILIPICFYLFIFKLKMDNIIPGVRGLTMRRKEYGLPSHLVSVLYNWLISGKR